MSKDSFTLIELLVVIAVLAVLSVVVILALNPAQLLRQARDSNRLSDFDTLRKSISLYVLDTSDNFVATDTTVYVSLPDANADCSSYNLPILTSPWQYRCSSEENYRKVDGTGWIPVNFNSMPSGEPLHSLPIDPSNDASRYYYFVKGSSSYEFAGNMESKQYSKNALKDGGADPIKYETGSNLNLASGAQNLITPEKNRVLSESNDWSCYDGDSTPYHTCGQHITKTWVGSSDSNFPYLRYAVLSPGFYGAVLWGNIAYVGNHNYNYRVWVRAEPGSEGKAVDIHRYTDNPIEGTLSTVSYCVLEREWKQCGQTWQGRTGDGASTIYVFNGGNTVIDFDMAFPSVEAVR
jgi:prepilin-type N-terminal cleavage/methylation domain-containing protein